MSVDERDGSPLEGQGINPDIRCSGGLFFFTDHRFFDAVTVGLFNTGVRFGGC